jgi:hypothetical protein
MSHARRAFLLLAICAAPISAQQISSAVYTATFNNIGIEITFTGQTPSGSTVSAAITDAAGSPAWRDCHPLSRVAANRFAGSVFNLHAGSGYLIRIRSSVNSGDRVDTVATRSDIFPQSGGTVYHVAKNGSDGNTGLGAAQSFATLARALSVAQAGSVIMLHGGRYFESVTVPRSGTQSNPLCIRNAPGETAILDGRDTAFRPSWASFDAAAGIYRCACARQPNFAYYNGQHLFACPSLNDLVANTWKMASGFFCDGTWMYVRLPHAGAPAAADTVEIPAYTTGITCSGKQYVQIRGIEIGYFGLDEYSRGIYFDGSSYNLVDSCFLHHSGIGVAIKRASNCNTVQNCRFTESPIDTWNWSAVKEGSGYYEAGGVYVYGSTSANSGNVVRNNRFFRMFDGSHLYSEDEAGPTADMDFYGNVVESVNDDCIETDGAGSNCRIYGNTFRTFLTGVSVAPAAIGPTYVFRNIFAGWETHGGYVGYPVKFNVESDLATAWVYIYHNTCYTAAAGQPGFLFKEYSGWSNVISRNNIFAGTDYAFESWPDSNPVDFDYDALYTSASGRLFDWAGAKFATVAAFSAKTGQETHGIAGDPKFAGSSAADFHLSEGSPLVDKGVAVPNINDGFAGKGPDTGCFEYGSSGTVSVLNPGRPYRALTARMDPTGRITLQLTGVRTASPISVQVFTLEGRRIYSGVVHTSNGRIGLPTKVNPGIYLAQAASAGKVYSCFFPVAR